MAKRVTIISLQDSPLLSDPMVAQDSVHWCLETQGDHVPEIRLVTSWIVDQEHDHYKG